MNSIWGVRANTDKSGKALLSKEDLDSLHQAVVEKCDLNDGVEDGVIGDPRECDFDPGELRCQANKKNGCLTPKQIDAVKKIYGGPVTSSGVQIAPPVAMKGSEQTWTFFFGGGRSRVMRD